MPTEEKYSVDYFIAKFEAIPEEKWITNSYGYDDAHCALGHCGEGRGDTLTTDESCALRDIMAKGLNGKFGIVQSVNDGCDHRYQQSTPKARILAALQDIKGREGK